MKIIQIFHKVQKNKKHFIYLDDFTFFVISKLSPDSMSWNVFLRVTSISFCGNIKKNIIHERCKGWLTPRLAPNTFICIIFNQNTAMFVFVNAFINNRFYPEFCLHTVLFLAES